MNDVNFFKKNKISFRDISLKDYKRFFDDVLCNRIFVYYTKDNKISLYFQPNNFMHIVGCHHIINLTANKFNLAVENGDITFEYLQKKNAKKFNDYKERFLNFINIYHVLINCEVIYFNKLLYNKNSKIEYKYILFEDVFNKKIHLGIDTFNKGKSYFCKSLLVTSYNNNKIIKNQQKLEIEKIEVLDKFDKSIIEQRIFIMDEDIIKNKINDFQEEIAVTKELNIF